MEQRWSAFATAVIDWIAAHRLVVYIVLGAIAWAILLMHYPPDSLTPVYANY